MRYFKGSRRTRIVTVSIKLLVMTGILLFSVVNNANAGEPIYEAPEVPEVQFSVRVTNASCPDVNSMWSYSSEDAAVKDTIPGEWWPPSLYGGNTPSLAALESAAVIIRSVIKYWVANPKTSSYAFDTAGVDWQGGQTAPQACFGILNTELNAQRHSRSDYNSNLATDATGWMAGFQYIVDSTPSSPMVVRTNESVEKSTVACNQNSGDYQFCALQALFGDETNGTLQTQIQCLNSNNCLSDNRYARNINTTQTSPSGPLVQFQAEAFVERTGPTNPRLEHAWLCLTNQPGHTGYCAMRAEPDNGANVLISDYAGSPFLVYHVPFPASAPTPHYVWIYAYACGGPDDTVFAGMDGALTPGSEPAMTGWSGCTWQWKSQLRDGGRPVITPAWTETNGSYHRFYLWMKEDGIRVDRVILAQDRCWKPSGAATPPGC